MHTDDGHIVHQCLSGNTGAFALLVDKYKARLFALVYAKVGQFEDAEDITQDVFLNAYRKLSTLRRWDNFYAWLYSIASNRCKEFHRAEKRRLDTAFLADQSENYQADMDSHTEKLRNEKIHDALDSLPEIHRQVLVLRYMAGMRSKEIAQTLRVSPNTVNQRLMRARTQLKVVLNEEAITMIPDAFAERKLQPGFTAQIIELIKGTQIQTTPHKTALPLGLSAAGGVILLLLSLSIPQSPLYPVGEWLGGPLPLKTQALKNGELAVDAAATEVAILGGEQADGSFGQKPKRRELPTGAGQLEPSQKSDISQTRVHLPEDVNSSTVLEFSPDGTKMVYFSSGSPSSPSGLIVRPIVSDSPDATVQSLVLVDEGPPTVYYQPKWSPNGRWIAFYRHSPSTGRIRTSPGSGEDMDVCMISAAGGELHFLASTGSNKRPEGLSWSPDGKELAFERWNGEKTDIFIVSVATRQVRPFTTDGKENKKPVWSGDGRWITYLSRRGFGFVSQRWIQALDGGKRRVVHGFELNPLVYSTDGRWIAYFHFRHELDSPKGFYASRINSQGELLGKPVLLRAVVPDSVTFGSPKRWTSSKEIVTVEYPSKFETYTLRLKNGDYRHVNLPPSLLWQFEHLQWLADGKHLCLPSVDGRQPGLLNAETGEFTSVPISLSEGTQLNASTFAPDGNRIAFVQAKFVTTPDGGRLYQPASLQIMPISGGPSTQLTHGNLDVQKPRWSPDGRRIAFLDATGSHQARLCVVAVSSGKVKRLTKREIFGEIAWSPDGKTLAYFRLKEGKKSSHYPEWQGDVYVISASGGAPKRITHTLEHEAKIAWTPDGNRLTFATYQNQWVVSVDDEGPTKLQDNFIRSSWSSDGKTYLVYAYGGKFQRVSVDGSISSEFSFPIPINANSFHMSPDGETILFAQGDSSTKCWKIDVSHLVSQ